MEKELSIEKEFVPHQESLELKELGFDEPCFGYYEPNKEFNYINWEVFKDFPYLAKNSEWQDLYGAPTFSQAFRFFREKYDLCGYTRTASNYIKGESKYKTRFSYEIYGMNEKSSSTVFIPIKDSILINVSTHEEAELACLRKLIEIVKEQKS